MIIIKVTAVLALAAIVQAMFYRRASAATRHLVWALALASVLALPIASLVLPEWSVAVLPAARSSTPALEFSGPDTRFSALEIATSPAPVPQRPLADSNATEASAVSWWTMTIAIYAAGALGFLMFFGWQHWRLLRRLARHATVVQDRAWTHLLSECAASLGVHRLVRLLSSRDQDLPATMGTRRPAIIVPSAAESWPGDRRRAVMLHELAHVARYDCLVQTLAMIACALYWFHPGVWWVARRLRVERELACDDRVLAAGTEPHAYARHLLEIAYASGRERAPALAMTMARPGQLEGRLLAAVDASRNRAVPAFKHRLAGAIGAAAVLLVLAGATLTPVAAHPAQVDEATAPVAPSRLSLSVHSLQYHLSRLLDAAAGFFGFAQDTGSGTWEIRTDTKDTKEAKDTKGLVHLRLSERNSSSGTSVPIAQLEGLTAAQLTGAGGPVQFRLKRDAGTFTFEGIIRNGVGAGTFSFAADPNFPAALAKRGITQPTAAEQYKLARYDVGFAFLDEMAKQGYTATRTSELVRAAEHGVSTTYLREMGALGYKLGSLEALITLRDHGITPEYVRDLADLGYKGLAADAIRNARDHGITPDYVRAMREAGYGSLPMDQLVNARDHGITPEYVRELGDAGHRKLPLDQLIRVRDHGVTSAYAREMGALGYKLPIEELVQARDHGVTVEYVRGMAALGYQKLPMSALIKARDHGVTLEYAQELKKLGYENVPLDDLVGLRDYGMTAERIRNANAKAGTRLPLDLLKSLARGGN